MSFPALPKGFSVAGVSAGIKRSGGLDLSLVVSEREAAGAGVFTTNLAAAAPVHLSRTRVGERVRAVVINSGCANACTGERGLNDARATAAHVAEALGVAEGEVLVCSTGLIGSYLDMDKVRAGITAGAASLGTELESAAKAIMTTDTVPKSSTFISDEGWSMTGFAKGAGMIAPNMATMLAVLMTDAAVGYEILQSELRRAVDTTFNRITVDGDTSTNDSVICMANGASGVVASAIDIGSAMRSVCADLAAQIVRDGEGATKLVKVTVSGAAEESDALLAADAVARSLLVKTAVYGRDPNWGRVVAALGYSGCQMDLSSLSVTLDGVKLFEGEPVSSDVSGVFSGDEVEIHCDLGVGDAEATVLTTDLTERYVQLNAEYET